MICVTWLMRERVQSKRVSGIGALHRIPPSRVLSGPGPRPPDTPTGATPGTTAPIKSGAQPYIRAHAPLPDTPTAVILCPPSKGRIKAA